MWENSVMTTKADFACSDSGNEAVPVAEAASRVVDPVPSALVLTAIVIGVGITALMLAYAALAFAFLAKGPIACVFFAGAVTAFGRYDVR